MGPLSFVMNEADVYEMIHMLGNESVPVKRSSKTKFFWLPQKCAKSRKLLWFMSGYEVDLAWSDGRQISKMVGMQKGEMTVIIAKSITRKSIFTRSGLMGKPPHTVVKIENQVWRNEPVIRHTKLYYCNEEFVVAALKDFT